MLPNRLSAVVGDVFVTVTRPLLPPVFMTDVQPHPQGLLGIQSDGSEKSLANSGLRVSKNNGDFH